MIIKRISDVLKEEYGEKIYRLSLSSGCTCPNRDGKVGYGGCTFCSGGGSGEFASHTAPIAKQIEEAKQRIAAKTGAKKFIAYFQSYSNTYGDPETLKKLYLETIRRDDIVILSLGTRPDCLPPEIMNMLCELNGIKPVWVELGLQTVHERTAERIHRGYSLDIFREAYHKLKEADIDVIVHVILGLPGETKEDMLETVRYLASLDPALDGIKLQMLQILRGTALADEYLREPFPFFSLDDYGDILIDCLKELNHETVIHRITGDGPKSLLIEPLWCADKKTVLNNLNKKILLCNSEKINDP